MLRVICVFLGCDMAIQLVLSSEYDDKLEDWMILSSCMISNILCLTLNPHDLFLKIRFIIHVLKNACRLIVCLILWDFTINENNVYEISFLLV